MKRKLVTFFMAALAAGCASVQESANPTASTLLSATAGAIGHPESDVSIFELRRNGSWTYYVAQTSDTSYACRVASGGFAAVKQVGTFGMVTETPICMKK